MEVKICVHHAFLSEDRDQEFRVEVSFEFEMLRIQDNNIFVS